MLGPHYDEESFSDDVIARWGVLSGSLSFYEGLLLPQMAELGRLCGAHPEIAKEILWFSEDTFGQSDAISELENAIALSFLDWEEMQALKRTREIPPGVARIAKEQREGRQRGA